MWAWGFAYINYPDTVETGEDLHGFFDRTGDEHLICYFHNLRFDGTFILDHLFREGYEHIVDGPLYPGSMKSLISDMGQFYSIDVMHHNGAKIQFRDSYKKLPFTVERVAKAFKMEMRKGEIDYHKHRPVGYRMDANERAYMHNDVSIMAHAMSQVISEGMTKLTVGSDSLSEYKKLTHDFDKWFPILSYDTDQDIRAAYRGGFTYADPRFSKRHLKQRGHVFDVNSLYPYVMRHKPIPYGEPNYHRVAPDATEDRPLTIFEVTFTATIKPDHIPCIQIKNSSRFSAADYITETGEPVTMTVTNIDWELFNDHYDIDVIEYGPGYSFKAATGLFDDYIDKWSAVKARETGGRRELAKLHLNSLYGKFATNPDVRSKTPTFQENRVKLVLGDPETRDPVYTAAGVFITAHARSHTIRAAQDNYSVFAYADTDSLHLMTDTIPDNLNVHDSELGAWAHEYEFTEAFFMRSKAYGELMTSGEMVVRIAGVPTHISEKLTFTDFYDGKEIKGKLIPKTVPGGVVLKDIAYELRV